MQHTLKVAVPEVCANGEAAGRRANLGDTAPGHGSAEVVGDRRMETGWNGRT